MSERAGQELSAEARQLIANARGADDPTAEDEARVKARWLAGIAAGAGVSSLSEAVRAAASTGWSWGLKAAVLAGAAAVAAVGVYLGWPEAGSPEAGSPEAASPEAASPEAASPVSSPSGSAPAAPRSPARDVAPAVAELPGVEAAPVVEPEVPSTSDPRSAGLPSAGLPSAGLPSQGLPSAGLPSQELPGDPAPASPADDGERAVAVENRAPEPVHEAAPVAGVEPPAKRATTARPARSRPKAGARKPAAATPAAAEVPSTPPAAEAPVSPATGQLGEEIARLSEVRGQLQAGAPARALELLSDYRSRFAEPNLAMEADALQVDALCRAGQREASRQAAAAFARRWPGSPLEQRVSGTCQ